jgi:hypothetical protein
MKRTKHPLLQWFTFDHLDAELQVTARRTYNLANRVDRTIPAGPEKDAGMRKLLEAKDCFVRAAIEGGASPDSAPL